MQLILNLRLSKSSALRIHGICHKHENMERGEGMMLKFLVKGQKIEILEREVIASPTRLHL